MFLEADSFSRYMSLAGTDGHLGSLSPWPSPPQIDVRSTATQPPQHVLGFRRIPRYCQIANDRMGAQFKTDLVRSYCFVSFKRQRDGIHSHKCLKKYLEGIEASPKNALNRINSTKSVVSSGCVGSGQVG